MHLLISTVALSLDSFLVCLGIGWHVRSWHDRLRLAMVFGGCDAVAAMLGSLWHYRSLGLTAFAGYLLCAFLLGQTIRPRRMLIYALPLLLSLDNLLAGVPANLAAALGAGSALMALIGLGLAAAGQHALIAVRSET